MDEIFDDSFEIDEDTYKGKYLTFYLDKELYGITLRNIVEIIGIQEITEVPEMPVYVKGIINLRGKIIPVMDIRLRFKKPSRTYNNRTCIIIIEVKNITLGIIVDGVTEVSYIHEQDIIPPPQFNNDFNNKYINAIGKVGDTVRMLLDCEKLLTEEEFENLTGA
jgi:purine-binding chemotaxis protein CheW